MAIADDLNARTTSMGTSLGSSSMPVMRSRLQSQQKQLLAISFIELILHNRGDLFEGAFDMPDKSLASLLYMKFRFAGVSY